MLNLIEPGELSPLVAPKSLSLHAGDTMEDTVQLSVVGNESLREYGGSFSRETTCPETTTSSLVQKVTFCGGVSVSIAKIVHSNGNFALPVARMPTLQPYVSNRNHGYRGVRGGTLTYGAAGLVSSQNQVSWTEKLRLPG